jgi:hypothetical protein
VQASGTERGVGAPRVQRGMGAGSARPPIRWSGDIPPEEQ